MELIFPTEYQQILAKLDQIDPIEYAKTRNYEDGAVTYLSPYLSRGVISTQQVLASVLRRGFVIAEISAFVKELCWRDYFQRLAQVKDLNQDIKQAQSPVSNDGISSGLVEANTGINGIDAAIQQLYATGYMHNHCRMYVASLACNIAKSHWLHPSQWMYYHLLDGDWASNRCSWQWVAGANSQKKYIANQENISRYTKQAQVGTFLDHTYEEIMQMETPANLQMTQTLTLEVKLPPTGPLNLDASLPTFIYNYYNLDPLWHKNEPGNRVLLLEPEFFKAHPVDKKCIDFMLALSANIPNIQVCVDTFENLQQQIPNDRIYFKEHPLNSHYEGNEESRDWICEQVKGYFPSFFAYWKHVEKIITN